MSLPPVSCDSCSIAVHPDDEEALVIHAQPAPLVFCASCRGGLARLVRLLAEMATDEELEELAQRGPEPGGGG